MARKICWMNVEKCKNNVRSARANQSTHQFKYVWKVHQVCGICCVIVEKRSFLLRTRVSKAKAKTTYVLISRYYKIQHHALWYYLGKMSGYLRLWHIMVALCVWRQKGSFLQMVYEKPKRKVRTVASAKRSGQEDFQRETPPVSLASCSISHFFRACIFTDWSSTEHETDNTGTSILIPLLLLNFNMRLYGNPTAWYLFLATRPNQ